MVQPIPGIFLLVPSIALASLGLIVGLDLFRPRRKRSLIDIAALVLLAMVLMQLGQFLVKAVTP